MEEHARMKLICTLGLGFQINRGFIRGFLITFNHQLCDSASGTSCLSSEAFTQQHPTNRVKPQAEVSKRLVTPSPSLQCQLSLDISQGHLSLSLWLSWHLFSGAHSWHLSVSSLFIYVSARGVHGARSLEKIFAKLSKTNQI